MHTTMLWRAGVFSTATMCSPWRPAIAELRDGGRRVVEQALPVGRIGPRPGDDAGAVARPDLRLVGLDERIERGGIDVALLGEDRLQRAHAKLRLGELRAMFVLVMMVVIV